MYGWFRLCEAAHCPPINTRKWTDIPDTIDMLGVNWTGVMYKSLGVLIVL